LVETALAGIGREPRVGLEIESVPAILDLVERTPLSAVLALDALRGSGHERALVAQPIRDAHGGALATQLLLATSTQRPRGRLLELGADLIVEMLHALWQRAA
ncbi:MAG: LysR family transcriptional regulator, partial [Burkholderiaceae bacterium]